jgi:biopolymer transport protein ExbD
MVTTVFKEAQRLVIELPEASQSEIVEEKKLTATIDKEGRFDINGKLVGVSEVESALMEARAGSRSTTLIIRTDKLTEHRFVLDCMQAARRAGIEKIVLATEKEGEEKS